MRIAVLWTGLSGYLAACLGELQSHGVRLFVAHSAVAHDAPYAADSFRFFDESLAWRGAPAAESLVPAVEQFDPQAILAVNWHLKGYRAVLKRFRHRIPRILCMDNQWTGSAKQWLGALTAPVYIKPFYDAAWVPGERQAEFAERLGFPFARVFRGMYCCDFVKFSPVFAQRTQDRLRDTERFLFTGRFVSAKGVDTLREGYALYRQMVSDPWPLECCGAGPEAERLRNVPGTLITGFVQPSELPEVFRRAGCLVLPSNFEPWGVVVHEAAAAGVPVIVSNAVGSAVHLVQDGYNGFVCAPRDARGLARLFVRFTSMSVAERLKMGEGGHHLAAQITPDRWSTYLLNNIAELLGRDLIARVSGGPTGVPYTAQKHSGRKFI